MQKTTVRQLTMGDMAPAAITIIIVGVVVGLGIDIVADFQAGYLQDGAVTNQTAQYNASNKVMAGLTEFTDKLGLVALVMVVAIVIFLLVRYLMYRAR